MKILILNWRDIKHPLAGGAEISTHEHAKRWVAAGHFVTQFSSSFAGAKDKETVDGIRIIRKGNHYSVHLFAFIYLLTNLKNEIDLLVDEFHFIPFFTPLYSRKKKIAFIHETAEEVWFKNQYFPINIIGFLLEPLFFKLYTRTPFITVSQSTKKDLMKFGINEKNISVVHNGISALSSSEEKEKTPILIYLGRLANDKGTKDAIQAFFLVQQTIPECNLWIVGREEKQGIELQVRQLVRKLRIEEQVTFFGYVSEKRKYDLLKRAWVLIHPSVREGWGLTVIEAASQGTPSVAYNSQGLRDSIQDQKTGMLVDKRDYKELAEKIVLLLRNKKLYNSLSNRAKSWSIQFRWDKAAKEVLRVIDSV